MSSHTPGPWIADDAEGMYFGVFADNGEPLAYLIECSSSCRSDMLPRDDGAEPTWTLKASDRPLVYGRWAEHAANARLIAAAPDLLSALQNMLMHIGAGREDGVEWVCEPIHADEIKAARAAIAKATGKTS